MRFRFVADAFLDADSQDEAIQAIIEYLQGILERADQEPVFHEGSKVKLEVDLNIGG